METTTRTDNERLDLHEAHGYMGDPRAAVEESEGPEELAETAYTVADEHRRLSRVLQALVLSKTITHEDLTRAFAVADAFA